MSPLARRIAAALAILALALAAWRAGLPELLTPARMHALLAESGAWGPLIYVAAFAVFEALGVPGAVFVIPASLAWPAEVAVTLSVFGATLAGILSFGMARWFVGDFARRHLPARLRRFTAQAVENPLRTV